jgi:hypothetical protein
MRRTHPYLAVVISDMLLSYTTSFGDEVAITGLFFGSNNKNILF